MKIAFENLSKTYGGHTVFENISGEINEGDVIGLIGVNGVGKSTLAKIMAGIETADSGTVQYYPSCARILYIEQFPVFAPGISVYEVISRMVAGGTRGDKVDSVSVVRQVLNSAGFDSKMWGQEAATLSGGEKTKLSLCKAMVADCDFLLLDEPSNHLDIESCDRLEEYVQNLNKPVLIISHDRYLLDSVANKIWELTSKGLRLYQGNYSAYKNQKQIEIRNAEKEYNKQQAKIESLQRTISDRKDWYAGAHKAAGQNDFWRSKAKKHASVLKSKKRELEKLERNKLEKPKKEVSPAFDVINKAVAGDRLPPVLIQARNLEKSFGDRVILNDCSFNIMRGDKIAVIGKNGSGKTTLLKMICKQDSGNLGTIAATPSLKIGYFAQELDDLDDEASILEYVLASGSTVAEARLLLASLLFRGDDVLKKIGNLSMGEKGRVAFARLILSGANMLVLDEPTNHMDIVSREKIEDVLTEFKGAILVVSHDRYFINRVASKIFRIDRGNLTFYDGGYDYYVAKSREDKERSEKGEEYKDITDKIRRLECELAFISGRLNNAQDEEEKEKLDQAFIKTARELNAYKKKLQV